MTKYIVLSGGCDPIHPGHVRYITEAKKRGPVLFILNTNSWLERKKGYYFMTFKDRAAILEAMGVVVIKAHDYDGTVIKNIKSLHRRGLIQAFCKGGDRKIRNTPELYICRKLGIPILFGVGGGKRGSSSALVERAVRHFDISKGVR